MPTRAADTPFEPSAAHLRRIQARAHRLWEAEGRPAGQEAAYLERARELDAIETNPAGLLPVDPTAPAAEEAALQENLGEFPSLFTDQGEHMTAPESREIAREFREGER